jgi:hypothetical protein
MEVLILEGDLTVSDFRDLLIKFKILKIVKKKGHGFHVVGESHYHTVTRDRRCRQLI